MIVNADEIKETIKTKKLTYSDVAFALGYNNKSSVSLLLNGDRNLSLHKARKLVDLLGCKVVLKQDNCEYEFTKRKQGDDVICLLKKRS